MGKKEEVTNFLKCHWEQLSVFIPVLQWCKLKPCRKMCKCKVFSAVVKGRCALQSVLQISQKTPFWIHVVRWFGYFKWNWQKITVFLKLLNYIDDLCLIAEYRFECWVKNSLLKYAWWISHATQNLNMKTKEKWAFKWFSSFLVVWFLAWAVSGSDLVDRWLTLPLSDWH